jgi:hypothetical protein
MNKIATLLVFVSVFCTLPAWADEAESIFGIATNAEKKTLSIEVLSSGCTDKSYFSFALEGGVLTFKRIKRDACKAMPSRHAITYSLEELGIKPQKPFRLGNPISYSEHLF